MHASRKKAEVSVLDGTGAAFYTQEEKKRALLRKIPVSTARAKMCFCLKRWTLRRVELTKHDDDAQEVGPMMCKQCFGIVEAPQGNIMNLYNHFHHHHNIKDAMKDREPHQETPATGRGF